MQGNIDPNLIKLLNELKDVHYPEVSLWWPPAPGIIFFVIILFVFILFIIKRYIKKLTDYYRSRPIRQALRELNNIEILIKENKINKITALQKINFILRKSAIIKHKYSYENIASITGHDYIKFLNSTGKTKEFDNKNINLLINNLAYCNKDDINNINYNLNLNTELAKLINITRKWIKINL